MQDTPALLTVFGSLAVASLAVEPAALATVGVTVLGAMVSGILAYRFAIKTARREIAEAFEEHIEKMHTQHEEFVAAVVSDLDGSLKE